MSQIDVRHEADDRFRMTVRGHEIVVDQPAPSSGDAGPTPTELFVASLAGCAGFYARRFLARHGIGDGELAVRADFSWAADHSRVAEIRLRIETAHGIPESLQPALMRVLEHCTVHESLRQPPIVSFDVVPEDAAVHA